MVILKDKLTIGAIELVDLPELGLYNINAKIDTGAETSVLHCDDFEIFEQSGRRYIRCYINEYPQNDSENLMKLTFPIHREREIKNSFGQAETRHIFITKIRMFDTLYDIKISVRDRSAMSYPMLLGKNFINGKFLVDVSKKELAKNSH